MRTRGEKDEEEEVFCLSVSQAFSLTVLGSTHENQPIRGYWQVYKDRTRYVHTYRTSQLSVLSRPAHAAWCLAGCMDRVVRPG